MAANRRARPGKQPDRSAPTESRTFVVCGPRPVSDTNPGEILTATLTVDQAEALIAAGHIREATEDDLDAANDAEVRIDHIDVVDDDFVDADDAEFTAGVEPVRPDGEPTTDDVEPVRPEEDEAGHVAIAENPTEER